MLPPPRALITGVTYLSPSHTPRTLTAITLIEDVNRVVRYGRYSTFDSGVGQEDIDPAPTVYRRIDVSLDLFRLGDIRDRIAGPFFANCPDRVLERRLVKVDQHDPGAFVGKQPCGSLANPTGCARNQGCLPFQADHSPLLSPFYDR